MARPQRHNADYFSHDNNMRNHRKIKAVRQKFDHLGYSVYCMTIELLTASDYFRTEYNEVNLELISGDFGLSVDRLKEVFEYAIKIDLFQMVDGFLQCNSLQTRLEGVLLKRKLSKERVSVTETPQSKEKESKVKETIVNPSEGLIGNYDVVKGDEPKPPIVIAAKIADPGAVVFSDYEQWAKDAVEGNDAFFEQMVMKEKLKINGALADYARSYLALLAEYPKKAPPDQHRFRVAFIGHISEKLNSANYGQRNTTKGGSGQINPEPGKEYDEGF